MPRTREILTEIVLPLTRDDVIALSARLGEPDWLLQRRLHAWALAESIPMPTVNDEPWRRTDPRRVDWQTAVQMMSPNGAALSGVPAELYAPLIGERQGGLLVFMDGKLVRAELSDELAAQGVIFTDLSSAFMQHRELVERFYMTQAVRPDEGKFAALTAALWTHGVFLYVPRGVQVELPLHSLEYSHGAVTTAAHILAVLEDGASATYLHESASPTLDQQVLHLGVVELIAGRDADLRYVGLQDFGEHSVRFGHQRARVGRGGRMDWISGELGTRFSKVFMTLDLDGDDSWGRISGLYFPHDRQHVDLDTQQNHHALRTTSDLLFKGALKGHSRSVWQGMILVDPGAQQTDGFQANRNMLLETTARADSIPGLEIQADNVRCTHAATIGRVDDTELFYLMTRGIPRQQAIELIVEGFFDPVMQRIPFEGVRERLAAHIDQRLLDESA